MEKMLNDTTGEPSCIRVNAHFHSWHRYIDPGSFGDPPASEIASRLIGWVRKAMAQGFLVAEDPPWANGADPEVRLVDLAQARREYLRGAADRPLA